MTPTQGAPTRRVLFIQGAGKGAHDDWDARLVASLRRELGRGSEIDYPRMPDEDDPSPATWAPAIARSLAALGAGGVVIGHSVGGTILMAALVRAAPVGGLAAIVLIAAPFVGPGGYPGDGLELPGDLGGRLPRGVPVHIFHGGADETVPPAHAELYARAIPQARVHRLAGRDHQLNDDLGEVAAVIQGLGRSPAPPIPS